MSKAKQGKITPNGVVLQTHENATVVLLTELGHDIELLPKSNIAGIHTPDIKMLGLNWELKSPKGEGKYLIANTIQRAVKQSPNLIIDLRRTKRHQTKCLQEIKREAEKSRSIKNLVVITKSSKLLIFKSNRVTL